MIDKLIAFGILVFVALSVAGAFVILHDLLVISGAFMRIG